MNTQHKKERPFSPWKVCSNSKEWERGFKEWERGFNVAYYRNLERRHDFSEERSRKSFQKNGGKYGK